MNISTTMLWFGCAGALSLSACALTSRSEAIRVRYFTLEGAAAPQPTSQPQRALELRLGRVEASDYLSEEIAFRNTRHELEYYEEQRWTEKPQEYLRRALMRALFQERGVTRSFSGIAPTLDVELVEFEELRGPQPKVRLQAIAILHDERRSHFEETFVVERPIAGVAGPLAGQPDHTEATASALADALQAAVERLTDRVIASLASESSVTSTSTSTSRSASASP
jgi:cholesterol transport system auxiliary component